MKMDIELRDDHKEESINDSCLRDDKSKSTFKGECLIDIKGSSRDDEKSDQICRICHFGIEDDSSIIIQLGCDCKGELGSSHHHCAQAWFQQKGNRLCEICGKIAKNISTNNGDETSMFMLELNEMRIVAATLDNSRETSRFCKQSFCNILLACLVLAFLLPWFFRWADIF